MARGCGCSQDVCGCTIVGINGATVTGNGSPSNPYVIEVAGGGGSSGSDGRFTGEITGFGGPTPPSGWLVCNGAAVNRTVYADLFAVIGVAYGAGDGATTFNLPDLADAFLAGAGGSLPRGSQGGSLTKTLTSNNLPSHSHTLASAGAHTHDLDYSAGTGTTGANVPLGNTTLDRTSNAAVSSDGSHTHTVGATGSGTPFDIMPPYAVATYIIRT